MQRPVIKGRSVDSSDGPVRLLGMSGQLES
jgi:hypothetical protein